VIIQLHTASDVRLLPSSWAEAGALAWPCGLSRAQWRSLNAEQLATLAVGLDWLQLSPIQAPLRSSFRVWGTTYHLPGPKFEDGTAIEFAMADDYFKAYQEGDDSALVHLLATLARPLRGTERQALRSQDEVQRRGRTFRRLGPEWLATAGFYWAGVKEYTYQVYGPWLFQSAPDTETDHDPTPDFSQRGPDFGWWGRFMDVAEAGVFGSLPEVHQTNFHELCMFLVKKEAEHRRQQEEIRKIRNTPAR